MKAGDAVCRGRNGILMNPGNPMAGRVLSDPFRCGDREWVAVEFISGCPVVIETQKLVAEDDS